MNKDFSKLEKYVTAKGENFDSDRYIKITVNDTDIGMCLNEYNGKAMVLTVDGIGINNNNTLIVKRCLKQLAIDSNACGYTAKEEKKYLFYLEEIRPNTECPQEDENMLVIKVSASCWNVEE